MRKTEKKLFVIFFAVAWVLAGTVWLVTPSRQLSNAAQEPTTTAGLTGFPTSTATPTPGPETFPAQVKVVNVGANKVEVRVVLSEATTLSGAELFFVLPASTTLSQSTCGSTFACPRIAVRESLLTISALRPLSKAEQPLSGEVIVATLTFAEAPTTPWTMNTQYSPASQVLRTTEGTNLLTPYQTELTLQQR